MSRFKSCVAPSNALLVAAVVLSGCGIFVRSSPRQAANFVSRVEESRHGLQDAKEQIQRAIDAANAIGQTEGDLHPGLQRLSRDVEQSDEKVEEFRKRLASMHKVSDGFFTNWAAELDKYQTEEFRKRSEARLEKTQSRYNQVLTTMRQADGTFEPLLAKLRDLVLFLNHNLNAEGLASIKNSVGALIPEATTLYTVIDAAIREADGFTTSMGPSRNRSKNSSSVRSLGSTPLTRPGSD